MPCACYFRWATYPGSNIARPDALPAIGFVSQCAWSTHPAADRWHAWPRPGSRRRKCRHCCVGACRCFARAQQCPRPPEKSGLNSNSIFALSRHHWRGSAFLRLGLPRCNVGTGSALGRVAGSHPFGCHEARRSPKKLARGRYCGELSFFAAIGRSARCARRRCGFGRWPTRGSGRGG